MSNSLGGWTASSLAKPVRAALPNDPSMSTVNTVTPTTADTATNSPVGGSSALYNAMLASVLSGMGGGYQQQPLSTPAENVAAYGYAQNQLARANTMQQPGNMVTQLTGRQGSNGQFTGGFLDWLGATNGDILAPQTASAGAIAPAWTFSPGGIADHARYNLFTNILYGVNDNAVARTSAAAAGANTPAPTYNRTQQPQSNFASGWGGNSPIFGLMNSGV